MSARRPQGTGSLYRRGVIWHIQYYRHGVRTRESSGSTDREVAERLLHRRLGLLQLTPEKATVGDALDLVLEDYEIRELRSASTEKYIIEANVRPAVGHVPLSRFGSADAKWYVGRRRKAGAANATINRELAAIGRGLTLAMEADPPLLTRRVRLPHLDESANVRQGFLEPEQYQRLLGEMPARLRPLLVVGYHTGMRKGELRNLRWSQVDLVALTINLEARQTKSKEARALPIYGDMIACLREQRASVPRDCPWVFPGRGWRRIAHSLPGWREACVRAGLPGLLMHDLRRSAVRNMDRAGVPREVAMRISGHKTESMFRRYRIVDSADMADAAAKLTEYLARERPKPDRIRRVK